MAQILKFNEPSHKVVAWETVLDDPCYKTRHPQPMGTAVGLSFQSSPPPTYNHLVYLDLHPDLIDLEHPIVSCPQIEGALYILTASEQPLRDGLQPGCFLGDQTGAGKTRTLILAIAEAAQRHKNLRILWISATPTLIDDLKAELEVMKCRLKCFRYPFRKKTKPEDLPTLEGYIIFTTYSTMSSRTIYHKIHGLFDLLDEKCWIILDESHYCRRIQNGCSKAVHWLQFKLPRAMVVYSTATVGSEPKHMHYMNRLGLWGTNAPFKDINAFLKTRQKRGLVSMELIANYLKSKGRYIARQLLSEDVKYEKQEIKLDFELEDLYDKSTDLWQCLLQYIKENKPQTESDMERYYWNSHQRYFRSLILGFKAPFVKELTKQYPLDKYAFVVAIQTTGQESYQKSNPEKHARMPMFSCCRQILFEILVYYGVYTKTADPHLHEQYENEDQNLKEIRTIFTDIERKLPQCAIDRIVEDFGGHEHVAEITGRKCMPKRIDSESESDDEEVDEMFYKNRPLLLDAKTEADAFQNGTKSAIIISQKGATGISLHSDKSRPRHLQRIHVVLELPWVPEHAVQQMGRSNRSNQETPPIYVIMWTSVPGELRFFQTLLERLNKMGALCDGDRASSTGLSESLDNQFIDHPHLADQAAKELILKIKSSNSLMFASFQKDILPKVQLLSEISEIEKVDMQKFLNRILGINLASQIVLLDLLKDEYQKIVKSKHEAGELETEIKELTEKWILRQTNEREYGIGTEVGCSVLTLEADKGIRFIQLENSIQNMPVEDRNKLVFFVQNDLIACCLPNKIAEPLDEDYEETVQSYNVYTPWNCNFAEYEARPFSSWDTLQYDNTEDKTVIKSKWQSLFELGEIKGTCLHNRFSDSNARTCTVKDCLRKPFGPRKFNLTVLTGCLLYSWDQVTELFKTTVRTSTKTGPQVIRIQISTSNGLKKMIGLEIPENIVSYVHGKLTALYEIVPREKQRILDAKRKLKTEKDRTEPYTSIENKYIERQSLKMTLRNDVNVTTLTNKCESPGDLFKPPNQKIRKAEMRESNVSVDPEQNVIVGSELDELKIRFFKKKPPKPAAASSNIEAKRLKSESIPPSDLRIDTNINQSQAGSYTPCKLEEYDLAVDLELSESDGSDFEDKTST